MNVRSPPSAAEASLTDRIAEPGLVIVPLAVPPRRLMPTPAGNPPGGCNRLTVNVSGPSISGSRSAATVNVWDSAAPVDSASKVSLPLVLSKSDSDAVSSASMLVA